MRNIVFSAGYFHVWCRMYRPTSRLLSNFVSSNRKSSHFLPFSSFSQMASFGKPPNVLVYTGEHPRSIFENTSQNLLSVLHPDKYVVYELPQSQVLVQPWRESIALLVVLSDTIEESTAETFRNYLARDGKMLVFCSNFTMPEIGLSCTSSQESFINIKYPGKSDVEAYHGKFSYNFTNSEVLATDSNNVPVVMRATCNQGILVVSEVHLTLDSDDYIQNVSAVPDNKKGRILVLESILGEVLGLEVCSLSVPEPSVGFIVMKSNSIKKPCIKEVPIEKGNSSNTIPLIFENEAISFQFDKYTYFSKLNTKSFGHLIIFFPVITSTMIPATHLSDLEGVVVIAGRQTQGRGRSGNQWISPEGSAMFTLHFSLSLSSRLGQRLSILQHVSTLAALLGIKKIPGYENLDLNLKWPNDLYYETNKKIGGFLVDTTIQGSIVHAYVGIGINVSNLRPTVCLNSIIRDHNDRTGDQLPPLTNEVVIARTLTELEILVDNIMTNDPEEYITLYCKHWLHTNQRVTVTSCKKEGTIKGLDEYGFLIVETDDHKTLTLQPDGNRFDMMQNLIITK